MKRLAFFLTVLAISLCLSYQKILADTIFFPYVADLSGGCNNIEAVIPLAQNQTTFINVVNYLAGAPDLVRGILIVTKSDVSGNRVDIGSPTGLSGEATLVDDVYGAAWGYQAVNDPVREDYSFINVGSVALSGET